MGVTLLNELLEFALLDTLLTLLGYLYNFSRFVKASFYFSSLKIIF